MISPQPRDSTRRHALTVDRNEKGETVTAEISVSVFTQFNVDKTICYDTMIINDDNFSTEKELDAIYTEIISNLSDIFV